MGMMPESEWSLRQKKELPWPARSGWTPCELGAGAGGAVVAMSDSFGIRSEMHCAEVKNVSREIIPPVVCISVKETGVICAVIVTFVRKLRAIEFAGLELGAESFEERGEGSAAVA